MTRSQWIPRFVRRHGAIRFAVLAAVGVLLAHDASYAAGGALGAGDAQFAITGHHYWATFGILVLLAGGVTVGAGFAALARLTRALRRLPASTARQREPGYGAELLRLWPRLLLSVTVVFVLQENIEHVAAGEPLPGLWVLSAPGYPMAIPALVVVTGLLAALGAWFRHRAEVLVRQIRAARLALALRHSRRQSPAPRWRDVGSMAARRLLLARPDAGRAPPLLSPS